jgi:hypothetical protein
MRAITIMFMLLMATNVQAESPFYVGAGYGLSSLGQDVDDTSDADFDSMEVSLTGLSVTRSMRVSPSKAAT